MQTYGQIRLDKDLIQGFGLLATLTMTKDGIIIAPYQMGDDGRTDCHVGKLSSGPRISLPMKYRLLLNIGKFVTLKPLADGKILVMPCSPMADK